MLAVDLSPLWISLKTASIATIFAFFTGMAIAGLMFAYQGKGKGLIDGLLTLPLILPPTVTGFLLLLLLGRNSPVGQLLQQWGMTVIFSWPATVIAATVVAFPLMYKTVLGALSQVDGDLIACARTLGASEMRIFWQVLLPLAWPGVLAGTILAFARALGEFGATLMLAGSIPGRTQTMPMAIFFAAEAGKMDEAFAWVLVLVTIALGAIAALNHGWDASPLSQNRLVADGSVAIVRWISKLEGWLQRHRNPQMGRDLQPTANSKGLTIDLQKDLSSFTLEAHFTANGSPLGILGASGSGKSLTLRCIAGLETPTQGRIVLNGRVLFDSQQAIDLPSRSRRIGFLFQNYALFPHLQVAQNIGFGLQNLSIAQRQQRIRQYLQLFQLQGLEHRYPHQLSGGQQQRVALARAMAIAPEALLLDEPLSALDSHLRSQIEQLLAEVFSRYKGVILFVTHKLEEAYRVCDRLLILSQGQVIASGPKAEIFERPPNLTVAQLTECKNLSRARKIDDRRIEALDWGCTLQAIEPIPNPLAYVGIRAHHLAFLPEGDGENTFPCWLAKTSETPHRMTLYLKLHRQPTDDGDYHLQVELFKDKWNPLKNRPFPWYIHLNPRQLILMDR